MKRSQNGLTVSRNEATTAASASAPAAANNKKKFVVCVLPLKAIDEDDLNDFVAACYTSACVCACLLCVFKRLISPL